MYSLDFDDCVNEEKEHISKKDCWSITDASFILTDFDINDCTNGENDRRRNKVEAILQSSIYANKLIPEYENNHFKPKAIIKWAIEKDFLKEGDFSVLLSEPDAITETDNKIDPAQNKNVNAIIKELEKLEDTAKKKGISFEREKLLCDKEMLLKWMTEKQGNRFTTMAQATFNDHWKDVKDWRCCVRVHVDKDFLKNIQG